MNLFEKIKIYKIEKSKEREKFDLNVKHHREDVRKTIYLMAERLKRIGDIHDWTKIKLPDKYYQLKGIGTEDDKQTWNNFHGHKEYHHPEYYKQPDINLLSIIEIICDKLVSAAEDQEDGSEITVKVEDLQIDKDLLYEAYINTVKMVADSIDIVPEEESDF